LYAIYVSLPLAKLLYTKEKVQIGGILVIPKYLQVYMLVPTL